jgi:hypothetical protein
MPVTFESAEAARAGLCGPPLADQPSAKVLAEHRTLSATAIDGWSSALFGVPFVTAGLVTALVALDRIHPQKNAPDWVIGIIAGMFFFGGLFFVVHGIRGVIGKAAWRREAAAHPNQPWLYDYRWCREGIAFSAFDDMVKRLLAAIVWTTFLLPFAWVGLTQRGAWPFLVAVGIFGLLGLIFWYRWAQMLFDFLRYGNSFLTYNEFPFTLGGMLRARLRVANHVSAIDELILTFRCVQEKDVTVNTGRDRERKVVCYELYAESATLDRDRLNGLVAGEIPVEFKIPPDQPATTLIATPPTYWEIEAKGKAYGVEYQAYFLVPVYKIS